MVKKIKEYDNTSISSLKGADRVRLRPAVIFGSDGLSGCEHSIFEILSNAIDEAREGFGTNIEIKYFKDKSIEVIDHGRGVPVDFNPNENRYNWELVYCELYAGGKYKNNTDGHYEYSLGINGLGACATQYSSECMDIEVLKDGFKYSLHFEKGENIGGLGKEPTRFKQSYTKIKWRPDLDVFTDISVPFEYFDDILKKQAVVNAGITFSLVYEDDDETIEKVYVYEKGIIDYVKETSINNGLSDPVFFESEAVGRDRADKPEYKVKMQVAFCFNNEHNLLEYYHNSSYLEYGGSPDKAVRSAFVTAIDQYLKQNNKYMKNESKITFNDITDSLILVTNSFSTITSYENQTKKSITNKFIQETMTEFLRHNLEIYFIENKADANRISEQMLLNKRSRETAEKARINIRKKLTGNLDVTNRVQKFVDCRTKDLERREVYIVEGDSALGSCKMGRDAEFQAIIPVRGKILNCLKSDYDRIFKSEIIVDLIRVLGCGIEVKSKHNKNLNSFDLESLRWNKVIICTDADVDGFQIRTLILTMLYCLMPTLIDAGKVFIAESPLFEITSKGKTYFAYTEKERVDIIAKLEGQKYSLQRSKGLGENEPDMMWETTMSPQTRRLIKVTSEDVKLTSDMFDLLLGNNLAGRKEHIAQNGSKYIDLTEMM